ncbi:MAG TPA: alpha-glucan family phosphorylase [Acidobacteriota bacterium]|nr:alpha-glucan family phosphorylase [Acidobacteriota bacterium]HNR38793.1 alpha-glucan family phosphorylase [Acidobacteriota bacterium]HNU00314.1 alpha-glucan family phosphorylase [Acidobacteriota bacterium]HPB27181.1 alpha-glucan family phosphorylase [Acidobacteriota bacterium]HQO24986.1 alpha-glucan family phosphorylase [Acidobacteriota bacterium]
MRILRHFRVLPSMPQRLGALRKITQNVWFSWNQDAISLFHRMDPDLWDAAQHNPVRFLGMLSQEKYQELLTDEGFLSQLDRLEQTFDQYMKASQRYTFNLERPTDFQVAYFSFEYGLTECLPLYSGGLGILSGEHLKSASDLCLPLYGIGLMYQKGYFQQYLNNDGWQQEHYPVNDFYNMPVIPLRDDAGAPLTVTVDLAGVTVTAQLWKVDVGRVPLYLLDTNLPENPPDCREITAQLYGGDTELRIRQEILLGIGGVRALGRLGLNPLVFHMNEGHSAFAALERIRLLMTQHKVSFDDAREAVYASSVFTTHTPVPAGNDMFPRYLMEKYFGAYVQQLGLSFQDLMSLGRQNPGDEAEPFCMTVLAIRLSAHTNAVSRLHGTVSRRMWQGIWPDVPESDIPITHITNGVHIPSWISFEMSTLYQRYIGPNWFEDPDSKRVWERIDRIPDSELWRTHERRRERLVAFTRRRLHRQLVRRGASRKELGVAAEVLNSEALTIGFARRFATYKRGHLIFRNPERLAAILNHAEQPVQIIIAGKAHPKDNPGKEIIRQIIHLSRREEFRHRVVFLEDYDMNVARYLVQGVDVWLNNPRRPLEACGTSGMKVTPNGGLNLSVLDGWWDEGYTGDNGWAIGMGEEYTDADYHDEVESEAIYTLLENEIVPLFYDRGRDNLPRGWIQKMKLAMKTLIPSFNTHRMLEDYVEQFYVQAAMQWRVMTEKKMARAAELAKWRRKLLDGWDQVQIVNVEYRQNGDYVIGAPIPVQADLKLGRISPEEVEVDAYFGPVDANDNLQNHDLSPLIFQGEIDKGVYRFSGEIRCQKTGNFGFFIRVLPYHPLLSSQLSLNKILWG